MTISVDLSPEELVAHAQNFGLTPEEIKRLSFQVFEKSTTVTAYPSNPRGIEFLKNIPAPVVRILR